MELNVLGEWHFGVTVFLVVTRLVYLHFDFNKF